MVTRHISSFSCGEKIPHQKVYKVTGHLLRGRRLTAKLPAHLSHMVPSFGTIAARKEAGDPVPARIPTVRAPDVAQASFLQLPTRSQQTCRPSGRPAQTAGFSKEAYDHVWSWVGRNGHGSKFDVVSIGRHCHAGLWGWPSRVGEGVGHVS